jgi:hypothetical protein
VENELEELKRSSAARIGALEGQLRAAATAAAAADSAAAAAALTAAHKIELLEHKLSAQETIFEHKLSTQETIFEQKLSTQETIFEQKLSTQETIFEQKLSTQETVFELKLAAARDATTRSIRIARLEERISVASLRAQLSAMRNPAIPGARRNFSS